MVFFFSMFVKFDFTQSLMVNCNILFRSTALYVDWVEERWRRRQIIGIATTLVVAGPRVVSLSLEIAWGKNAEKNVTRVSAPEHARAWHAMPRAARIPTPALLAARVSHSQSRSHGHLFCVLPHRFPSKRGFSLSKLSSVSLSSPFTFPLLIVTCVSVYTRWAHIGCAVAMPEVFFVNVNLREGINTDQITSARRKLVSSPDFFLYNLLGKVNVCLCKCVTPCTVLCNILFFFVTLCYICRVML